MNTKLAATRIKLQNWTLIIKDQKDSGLKVKEYCFQHNISKDAYYYWYRKVREAALHESGFVEITPPASVPAIASENSVPSEFLIQYREIKVVLPVSVPKETLANLVEVLANVK